jgi:hypothetical protein
VLIGQSVGSAIFGVLAIVVAWRIVGQLEGGVPQASVEEGLMANPASNPSPSRGLKKG